MYGLPKEITLDGKAYKIRENGDYRMIIDVIAALQDYEISEQERMLSALIIFYEDLNTVEDVFTIFDSPEQAAREMMSFIATDDEQSGCQTKMKLVDWVQDEKLIVSAVNNVARTEIRELPHLHWWTFISYFMAIGECPLQTIVGIRSKIARHKKLQDYEQEFKRNNPQYFIWKSDIQKGQNTLQQLLGDGWGNDTKEGL
ncbi:MAG: hypothetical protein J1F01_05690 [Oscillospiraceae bacterium]|nr:hypothetical protein [Oscillospiraceae bacterium]